MFFPLPLWLLRQAEGAGSTGVPNGDALKPCAASTHACRPPRCEQCLEREGSSDAVSRVDEGERLASPAVPSAPARTREPALCWDTGSSVRPGSGGELWDPSPLRCQGSTHGAQVTEGRRQMGSEPFVSDPWRCLFLPPGKGGCSQLRRLPCQTPPAVPEAQRRTPRQDLSAPRFLLKLGPAGGSSAEPCLAVATWKHGTGRL